MLNCENLFALIYLLNFSDVMRGNDIQDYKFLRIKGCLLVLRIIGNFDPVRYTDIEVEYIKKIGEKLSPGTLTKCLRDLEKNGLVCKEKDMYKITQKGRGFLHSLEKLSGDKAE